MRQFAPGLTLATSGYTIHGDSVAGSGRWYRLGDDSSWVHGSGGSYTASL